MHSPLRFIAIVAAALWFLTPVGATNAGEEYQHVANGDFEHGTSPWTTTAGATISSNASSAAVGSTSALVASTDGPSGIRQVLVGVTAPGPYRLSAAIRSAAGPIAVDLTLRLDSQQTFQFLVEADDDAWTTFNEPFVIDAATTGATLTVQSRSTGASFLVDAVTLIGPPPAPPTPTPSPTSSAAAPPAASTAVASGSPTSTTTATATPAPSPTIGAQMRNGDFELAGPDGPESWRKYGGTLTSVDSPVRGGARAVRLESATSSTKWLYQIVQVDPGAHYAFDAWVLSNDPYGSSSWLRVSWYPSADGSGESIASDDSTERVTSPQSTWRPLTTASVTAPPSARSARLRVMLAPASTAAATVYVDDAAWGLAPPPPPPPPTVIPATPATANISALVSNAHESAAAGIIRRGTSSLVATSTNVSTHSVAINEVLYDPDGNGPDAANEWVELFNAGQAAVNIEGWTLQDGTSVDVLPSVVLDPRSFVIIAASDSFFDAYPDFSGKSMIVGGRIGNGLGNEGDSLALFDSSGAVVDTVSWASDRSQLDPPVEDVPAGHSIERRSPGGDSNDAADFIDNERPTPGRAFDPSTISARPKSTAGTEILQGSSESRFGWVPWIVACASAAALAGTLGWRAWDVTRPRTPAP